MVLALEKLVSSKLMKKDANNRIATVDRNIGVVSWLVLIPSLAVILMRM